MVFFWTNIIIMEIKKEWLLDSFKVLYDIYDHRYIESKILELDNDDIVKLILRYHDDIEKEYGLWSLHLHKRIWTDEHKEILASYEIHYSYDYDIIKFKHRLDVEKYVGYRRGGLFLRSKYGEWFAINPERYQFFRERPYYLYKITGKLPYFLREILFDHEKPGRGPISPEIGIKFVHSDLIFRYL